MSQVPQTPPKVFISYSWSNQDHINWVINLAKRLRSDFVEVIIDKWHLKEGHDKYHFMEQMVNDPTIFRVLMILDQQYAEKANERRGGAGTETQIISAEIYNKIRQEKFIPIIAQRDDEGNPFIPTYLKTIIYRDLSSDETFEDEYDEILRNIFQQPTYVMPQLGKPPAHLFEELPNDFRTSAILRKIDTVTSKNPSMLGVLTRDFLEELYSLLSNSGIIEKPSKIYMELGKQLYDNIQVCLPLRDDYIKLVDYISKSPVAIDFDIIAGFFEKLTLLKDSQDGCGSSFAEAFSNFVFMYQELFLYTVAIALKNENYILLGDLFHSKYFFQDKYEREAQPQPFTELNRPISAFDAYIRKTFNSNFISPRAEIIIRRLHPNVSRVTLVTADLLCHYIASLSGHHWFPWTYIYLERSRIALFDRLISKRYFDKVKPVFNVSTIDELKAKLSELSSRPSEQRSYGYSGAWNSVVPLTRLINVEGIAKER
ncbi:toll/interleukin-1 receptor domain-containing protein [Chryseolinea sp. H1M3-3]|uniref:toll/interleukin-1 receptor domain-containing protein n=1 Tax=Chryseolinea sp. H1M3-3 TaxID=3034144 RepID=UPI0023EBB8D1|nr:toll/interleukin-1 receptor domain-containing protein [Chryseolinea sp. H1M3-3]